MHRTLISSSRSRRAAAVGLAALIAVSLTTGCQSRRVHESHTWTDADRGQANSWAVNQYFTKQSEAAIIRQATLRPSHFTDGTARLNARGERDLETLTKHLARNDGGRITLDRAGTPEELYVARERTIRHQLAVAGIDLDAVTIDEGPWSGAAGSSTAAATRYSQPSDPEPYNFHKSRETK